VVAIPEGSTWLIPKPVTKKDPEPVAATFSTASLFIVGLEVLTAVSIKTALFTCLVSSSL
jgi:hypothetical protein